MTRKPNMNLVSLSWFPPTLPLDTKIAWNLSRKYTLTECCLVAKSTSMCILKKLWNHFYNKINMTIFNNLTRYSYNYVPKRRAACPMIICFTIALLPPWIAHNTPKSQSNKESDDVEESSMMSIDVYWVTSDGMDDMRPTPDQSGPISNLRSECCDKVLNQRHLAQAHSSANFPLWHYHWIKERSPIWCGQIKKQMIQ